MALILVLEDDPALQFAFSEALEDAQHEVLTAVDTEQAMCLLRRYKPDVLLLDLMIDGTYSTDVANYAAVSAPEARVVYITGTGLFPMGELFEIGLNTHLVLRKPVRIADLTDMIRHVAPTTQADLREVAL